MKNKVIIKRAGKRAGIVDFLKSSRFGAALLICSTILESFYAFKLFNLTGSLAFEAITFLVSLIYASIVAGTIVFFALRNNALIVWTAVFFELSMNILLDIQAAGVTHIWFFVSQLAIGAILPLATKAFADEVSKKEISRKSPEKRNTDGQSRKNKKSMLPRDGASIQKTNKVKKTAYS